MIRKVILKSDYSPIIKIGDESHIIRWDRKDLQDPVYRELTPEEKERQESGEMIEREIIGYVDTDYCMFLEDAIFGKIGLEDIKIFITNYYNDEVERNILNGYQWTVLHGADAGTIANVWLSKENQMNYKAKHDAAKEYPQLVSWPMKYKIGERPDKTPIYEEFANIEELAQFYLGGIAYIEQCYNAGWVKKDSIDWTPYEEFFDEDVNLNE